MSKKKISLSELFKKYIWKVSFRLLIFLFIGTIYLWNKDKLDFTQIGFVDYKFELIHIFWAVVLVEMIIQVFPTSIVSKGCLKQFKRHYSEAKVSYTKEELKHLVHSKDKGARKVLLSWVLLNGFIGILYFCKVIGVAELVLICAFYYLSDLICILFFCPFQTFFMKNKCCVTCRIFAWGHIMMTTPLIFIPHIYSYSLVLIALWIAISWEITYRVHPVRFFEQTNESLKCKNCSDRLCIVKKKIKFSLH